MSGLGDSVVLSHPSGMQARILAFGATLQALGTPRGATNGADEAGIDIALGHANLDAYVEGRAFIGGAIGRFANRIAGGAFALDGQRFEITRNEGANTLHGGRGFHKALWRFAPGGNDARTTLVLESPDGEDGFPGALEARVTYALEERQLVVTFEARTHAPTIVSLTQHCYFNLAGEGAGETIDDHDIQIAADAYTPIDARSLPTGEIRALAGTAFDFTAPVRIGAALSREDEQLRLGGGFDHNFALRGGRTSEPKFAACLSHPKSGRAMTLLTTEPGLQFYTGQFLGGGRAGKSGAPYAPRAGLCLEPQAFPDAPNQPHFPSARLDPGEVYRHVSIYRFS